MHRLWMRDGKHFIWYRKVRESRNYYNARWVYYLTVFGYTVTWETK